MKSLYVKIALLGAIGTVHSVSMCMLTHKSHKYEKKATKNAMEVVNSIIKSDQGNSLPLALPEPRIMEPHMEPNFFTELPKEIRSICVPSTKPNKPIPDAPRLVDLCRHFMWLRLKLEVSSTSKASRFVMLRDNPDLADYIWRCNYGIRLEPNPTVSIKVSFERGLMDKSGVRVWNNIDRTEYERSYKDSIAAYKLMEKVRYNQENQPLVKCSIQ